MDLTALISAVMLTVSALLPAAPPPSPGPEIAATALLGAEGGTQGPALAPALPAWTAGRAFDGVALSGPEAAGLCADGCSALAFNNVRLAAPEGALFPLSAGSGPVSLAFTNGLYAGDVTDGRPDGHLAVAVGRGALLHGDVTASGGSAVSVTVADGGVWVVGDISRPALLTVEEGGVVYGALDRDEGGHTVLRAAVRLLEPGVYDLSGTPESTASASAAGGICFSPAPGLSSPGKILSL